jgi:hypothetical protein
VIGGRVPVLLLEGVALLHGRLTLMLKRKASAVTEALTR